MSVNVAGGTIRFLKVLVCDDKPEIVHSLQVKLEEIGHKVVTAFSGREAIAKIRSEKPDIAVVDICMPEMGGFEVLRAVRQQLETVNLPVFLMTESVDEKDIFDGYAAGADRVLKKPLDPNELITFLT